MKKKYLFMATAAIMMAGCASDDLVGDENISSGETPIAFNMNTPNATRDGGGDATATNTAHTDAAKALGNEFIVWGEKVMTGTEESKDAAGAENQVFNNYRVQYTASSANTSVSNTNDWEYVGIAPYNSNGSAPGENATGTEANAYVSPSIYNSTTNPKQTIKYWDDKAVSYTFTAVSAKQDDIKNQKVKITKTTSGSSSAKDKGYTIELVDANAAVGNIYVADRKVVSKDNNSSFSHSVVQMEFRNFQSKIRFGIYETVPGYKVVITGIKYNNDTEKTSTTKGFGVDGNFVLAGAKNNGSNTSYTVTYDANNHAQVAVTAGNSQDYIETEGTNWLSTEFSLTDNTKKCIGETAATATYDKTNGDDSKAYTAILPNPSNKTNLKLKVKYDLYSEDTGEKIEVDYKTVEVPAEYCTWKSNYAYTYLFKISDKSAQLYPITFDAVVVESTTGNQETITTVDEPSITTYVKGKTASDEYTGGDEIFAFAQDGTSTDAMTSDNMKLYRVTAATGFTITEASVKHALDKTNANVTGKKLTVTEVTTSGSDSDKPSYEAIPREDNDTSRGITGMKWKATAGTTYAVEYIKTTGEGQNATTTKYYKIVKIAAAAGS
jgi:hypothetical protein